jgi:hypothetical protein
MCTSFSYEQWLLDREAEQHDGEKEDEDDDEVDLLIEVDEL